MGSDTQEGFVFVGAWFVVVMPRPLSLLLQADRKGAGVGFTTIVAVNVRKLSRISCVAATWAREKGFALHAFAGVQ
jgi:hypothetical protein